MTLIDLFEKQKKYLNFFFDNLDIEKANEILDLFISCKNNIIFTGIGKSAIIAKKIAQTMLSTGTKAMYLSAVDALHGDIAIITKDDIFVILSRSGETKEIIDLIFYIKKRQAKVIAIVSNKNSKIAKISDYFIDLPLEKELCPYNLAPTTSTTIQLIFGDILTVALMEKNKKFSINEYALNHPAGAIGMQINLKVEDLMIKDEMLPICNENDLIKDILPILSLKKCGCLLIVDKENKLQGIFTDGDLRRVLQKENLEFFNKKMKDIMIQSPILIKKDILAIDAMKLMEEKKQITIIPVVENEKLIGLIRMHDIIQTGLKSLLTK
ncbi:MAG: Arabinose 5-phosphate isomerase KdsD [Candidatus Anoxychlamydiales bacterium]|nr:Arabinose 5-phosphate isomerase KdsD [Candidatus Anoxychlamydiales bacterium]NGX40913.1 Arabinose 5-phosphate isomerase KdsD [Candidatus Anoxychlamydiales bacterium]